MKKVLFKGCGTAIATPFNEKGVNIEEFKKLLNYQIDNYADAIIVCGTTGESSTLTTEEKISIIKCALEVSNGRVPIIAGTGSNNTYQSIKMSKIASNLGVDGLLIVSPYYNKTTQKGLIAHFSEIAKNVPIPIILYNVASRTGINIEPETCLELSKISNIVAIKEASGNISQVSNIINLCGDNLYVYSGNDDQIIPILSLGGLGVISVLSNTNPKFVHDMVFNFFNGNFEKAKQAQLKCIPLIHALFSEVNPIPVKAALNMIGFDFGIPRLPLLEMSEAKKDILKLELDIL